MNNNQFERIKLLIGENNLNKISSKTYLVLGLGGVGSYVVESLVRSGVNNIIIVDFDKIDITNLNRQLMTSLDNIGCYKTDELEKRICSINKDVNVVKINEFIDDNNIHKLFDLNPDYIIDCCDTTSVKKDVIRLCLDKNIKFITCMGTGKKLDPSKLEIVDIRKTSYDPLAKKIRKWVNDEKIKGKIMCCYSPEKAIDTGNVIGSMMFVPSSAGILIASYVIRDVIGK